MLNLLIKNLELKKIIICAPIFIASIFSAQVGINNSLPQGTLDITKSSVSTLPDGLITPRLTGDELKAKDGTYGLLQNSTVVYVTTAAIISSMKTSNITTPGFYYYNSTLAKWIGLNMPKFFYMPSVYFDTTTLGTFTKDLYQLYYNQFTAPTVKNPTAAAQIPVVGSSDLQYYITSFDNTVFSNVSITDSGVVTYTVISNAFDGTFLNIVFVVR